MISLGGGGGGGGGIPILKGNSLVEVFERLGKYAFRFVKCLKRTKRRIS